MLTQVYILKGKEVPDHLLGKSITFKVAENYKEAESQTKNGESDVVAKFNDGRVIALQGLLRTNAAKKSKEGVFAHADVGTLQTLADGYIYSVQAEGTPRTVRPETQAQRTERSVGNKLFERMASDEKFKGQMLKTGVAEQADFDAWQTARDAAAKAAAPAPVAAPQA